MSGAAAGAAVAAAIAQAIKASGTIVKIDSRELIKLLNRADRPLVVVAPPGFFSRKLKYLTNYKGLTFYAESAEPMQLPSGAELVTVEKIWIPG
jgi:hypothetical protein